MIVKHKNRISDSVHNRMLYMSEYKYISQLIEITYRQYTCHKVAWQSNARGEEQRRTGEKRDEDKSMGQI